MSHTGADRDDLRSERGNVLRERFLFRSWRRGTKESVHILGSFAAISLTGFDSVQLDRFEALLDYADDAWCPVHLHFW